MKETKSKYAILGMLNISAMSGYDIKKHIQESISNFWTESYGQIYPVLKNLVAEELVTKTVERASGKPDRHVYALTARGRNELHRWLAQEVTPKVERNELLLKMFFGKEASPVTTIKHVERFRELQRQQLERYRTIEKEIKVKYSKNANLPYWLLTVRYGERTTLALLDWCDEALVKLRRMRKTKG